MSGLEKEPQPQFEPYEANAFGEGSPDKTAVDTTATQAGTGTGRSGAGQIGGLKLNTSYLISPLGLLKIVEFFLLLLAFSTCAAFDNGIRSNSARGGRTSFFLFVTICSWLFVIFEFAVTVVGIIEKINLPPRNLILGVMYGIAAFFLLISSALIADSVATLRGLIYYRNYNRNYKYCDLISDTTATSCGTIEAACAFGFFSLIAFVADAVLHVFEYTVKRRAAQSADG